MCEDKIVWSCGCVTWKEGDMFFIKPCSQNCKVFKITIEESKNHGNKIITSDEEWRKYLIDSRPNLEPPKYRWRKRNPNSLR